MSWWSPLWSFSVSLSCLNSSTFCKSVSLLVLHLAPPAWELIVHRLGYFEPPTQSPAELLPAKMLQNFFSLQCHLPTTIFTLVHQKELFFCALKIYQIYHHTQTRTKGVRSILKETPSPICHESILSIKWYHLKQIEPIQLSHGKIYWFLTGYDSYHCRAVNFKVQP